MGCHSGLHSLKRLIVLIQGRKLEILVKTAVGVPTLGHIVTHEGAPGVPLQAEEGRDTPFSRPPHS